MIVIPCYNEENGLGHVLDAIPYKELLAQKYEVTPLVIDNNSTDSTVAVAETRGVTVIHEKKQGKGCAITTGFESIPDDVDIVAMIDGDASYDVKELPRLLEPVSSNFCDVVVGTRLNGRMSNTSMKTFNRFGNWFFTFLARVGYKTNVTDVCSGFFVWKKKVIDDLKNVLQSNGFSIEMEMIGKMARLEYDCYSVPISYNARDGTSSLRPVQDGARILYTWFKNLYWESKPNLKEASVQNQMSVESIEHVSAPKKAEA